MNKLFYHESSAECPFQRAQPLLSAPRARDLPHLDAAEPVAHVGEGILGGDVVHQHHPVRLPEKLLGHAAVPAGILGGSPGWSKEVLPSSGLKS